MALHGNIGLGIELTAADLASHTIRHVAKEFLNLEEGLGSLASKFAKFAAGPAALVGFFKLADAGADLEQKLLEIKATTSITGSEFGELKERMEELGAAGKASGEDSVAAFRALADSSLSSKQALDALSPAMDLVRASAMRLSPAEAGGLLAKTLTTFTELSGDATKATDLFARAMKSGVSAEEFSRAMKRAGKDSALLGGSLEEVLVNLAGMKAAGYPVEKISKDTILAASRTQAFYNGIAKARVEMGKFGTTAKGVAEEQSLGWNALKRDIGNAWDSIYDSISETFRDVLRPVLVWVRDALIGVAKWFKNISPEAKKTFGYLAVGAAVVATAWTVISSPILATIAAITAAAYVIYRAYESNFGGIKDVIEGVFGKISLAVQSLVELFTTGQISGALADDLLKAENEGVLDFVEAVSEAVAGIIDYWDEIRPSVIETFNAISEVAKPIISTIADLFGTLASTVGGVFKMVAGLISGDFNLIVRGLTSIVNSGIDLLNGLGRAFNNTIGQVTGVQFAAIEHVTGAAVAEGVGGQGAGQEFLDAEKERQARLHPGSAAVGPPVATSAAGTTGSVGPGVATTTVPSSAPLPGPGLPDAVNQQILEAIKDLGKQPVVVNGEITIDGKKLGDFIRQQARDRASGTGAPASVR